MLTKKIYRILKHRSNCSPLARELFKFSYVKEILLMRITFQSLNMMNNWDEITLELRSFIKQYIENGGIVLDDSYCSQGKSRKPK
jgi:hypothetical protein